MRKTLLIIASLALGCGSSQKQPPAEPTPPPVAAEPTPAPTPEPVAPPAEVKPPEPVDAVTAAPGNYKMVTENDTVRVLEVTVKPGDKIPAHKHPDHVVYVLAPGKLKMAAEGGEAQEVEFKAGQALFLPAQVHSAENTGTTELKAVIVELRKKGTPAPAGVDPLKAGKGIYKLVFEDEHARVMEVTFKKGAKIATHTHPDHVGYVISGGKLAITGADKKAQTHDLEPGQALFIPAETHSAKNAGKTPIKLVVFEIK